MRKKKKEIDLVEKKVLHYFSFALLPTKKIASSLQASIGDKLEEQFATHSLLQLIPDECHQRPSLVLLELFGSSDGGGNGGGPTVQRCN